MTSLSTVATLEKRSDEDKLLGFDFGTELPPDVTLLSSPTPTITAVNMNTVPGSVAVTVSGQTLAGRVVMALFAAGTHKEKYVCKAAGVKTSNGQTLAMTFILQINNPETP